MNNNFVKLVEKELLSEMPHLVLGQKPFDLEIEKFVEDKNFVGFIKAVRSIIHGKGQTDKYGNQIQLIKLRDKQAFIKQLQEDKSVPFFLWKLFVLWLEAEARKPGKN